MNQFNVLSNSVEYYGLYPIFWICVCITFFILIAFPLPNATPTWISFFASLTMLQDYVKLAPVDSVYWSLTYELGFYFFMFCLIRARLAKHIEKVAAIWIIGTLTFAWTAPFIPHPLHYLSMINGYGHLFAAGLIIYKITQTGWTPLRVFLLLLVVVAQYPQPLSNYDDRGPVASFIIAGHIVLFLIAVLTTRLSVLSHPWLVFLGAISYPLYLVHQMIGYVLLAQFQSAGLGWWSSFLLTTGMMIALAAALTYCADVPMRRWLATRLRD